VTIVSESGTTGPYYGSMTGTCLLVGGTHQRSYTSGCTVDQRSHQPTGSLSPQQPPRSSYAGSPMTPAIRRRGGRV